MVITWPVIYEDFLDNKKNTSSATSLALALLFNGIIFFNNFSWSWLISFFSKLSLFTRAGATAFTLIQLSFPNFSAKTLVRWFSPAFDTW